MITKILTITKVFQYKELKSLNNQALIIPHFKPQIIDQSLMLLKQSLIGVVILLHS